jgi:phage recombination protein Bet
MSDAEVPAMTDEELMAVLSSSIYPGAKPESIKMVIAYCRAAGLDPLQKPVHIVPMQVKTGRKDKDGWDEKEFRDVVMPGIGLYRTQAARSKRYAGVTEPEFGEDVTEVLDGVSITYPKFCRMTAKRLMPNGTIAEFTAVEFWKENYATKSGKSQAPNAMWTRRAYGQLAKCTEAQVLRKAFPEIGAQPTAEEMEGKVLEGYSVAEVPDDLMPRAKPALEQASVADDLVGLHVPRATEAAPASAPEAESRPAERASSPPNEAPPAAPAQIPSKPASAGQIKIIRAKLAGAGIEESACLAKFEVESLDSITVSTGNRILEYIRHHAAESKAA